MQFENIKQAFRDATDNSFLVSYFLFIFFIFPVEG